jgi:biopolymer transport protein ExbD
MAFAAGGGIGGPMADINVTPLVDVMLVLLIIFMLTAPLLSDKINIDLPVPSKKPRPPVAPDPIRLSVLPNGNLYWNDTPITEEGLRAQLSVIGVEPQEQQPELAIKVDKTTKYQLVADVMADAKSAGMMKIGFVSQ